MRVCFTLSMMTTLHASLLPAAAPMHRVLPLQSRLLLDMLSMCSHGMEEASHADALDVLVQGAIEGVDEQRAIDMIKAKGDLVLFNVLAQLTEDQAVLRSELDARIEAFSQERREELLSKYDESMRAFDFEVKTARSTITEEMTRLRSLNAEYTQVREEQKLNKDSVVGAVAFLVGFVYLGQAVNEALKVAMGKVDGDVASTVASATVNAFLAAVGVGTYFLAEVMTSVDVHGQWACGTNGLRRPYTAQPKTG
eukprot:CAMPEP_0119359076 /NCGR_PEP_ID=MMETSP1334-20130426/7060_1 /TAXON_ID=127549 /ORGANISM="Calcidiscus leptoporus, Strain RCC1130" /LENGTH=252 /DNA_ID=CAMNT_0007373675 /DNA_START=7 /DNA_END=766 /DNA_ORIENTATION=+